MKIIIAIFFLFIHSNVHTQKSSIGVNFGLIFGDGHTLTSHFYPGISIEYKYSLANPLKLKIGTGLYRLVFGESYVESSEYPILENNHNRIHPFITSAELSKLQSQGFRLNPTFLTIFQTSIPIEAGLDILPINNKHHSLTLGVTGGYVYSNLNHPRDQLPGDLKINDNTYQVTLLLNTEYRRLNPTLSGSISYEYKFNDYLIGLEWKNYNYFLSNTGNNPPIWIINLKLGYRF